MNYAMIKNGRVVNIIVADYTAAHMIKQADGHDDAINCDNYPVNIGDIYENGAFMTGADHMDDQGRVLIPARTVIERRMSDEEYIKLLESKNANLEAQLVSTNSDLQGFMDYYFSMQG